MKYILITIVVLLLNSCSSSDNVSNSTLQNIAVIQDGFDGDNPGLIKAVDNAHGKTINVLGYITNSYDVDGRFGDMFEYITSKGVPIFTDRNTYTRHVPSGRRYDIPLIAYDDNRPHLDSFAKVLEESSGNVILISGGHLTAFWYLAENYPNILAEKVSKIVIANGFNNLTEPIGSMNFTQGMTIPNPSGDAAIMTYKLLPNNIEVVLPIGTYHDDGNLFNPSSILSEELRYLHKNSPYYATRGGHMHIGDIDVFNYILYPGDYDVEYTTVTPNYYGYPQATEGGRATTIIRRNKSAEHIVQRYIDLLNDINYER